MNKRIHMNGRFTGALVLAAVAVSVLSCNPLTGTEGPAAEKARRCGEIAGRFEEILAGRKDSCSTHADCGCYNPVSASAGCGGVTDRATAAALGAMEKEFHEAGCPWPRQCAPWLCSPACVKGRCLRGN